MVDLRIVVSQQEKTKQKQLSAEEAAKLYGLKIGQKFDGTSIGLPGYELEITGGSDKDGTPMTLAIPSARKTRALISRGLGLRSTVKGFRKKKSIRGSVVSDDISQLNLKVVKAGGEPIDKLMGGEPAAGEKQSE